MVDPGRLVVPPGQHADRAGFLADEQVRVGEGMVVLPRAKQQAAEEDDGLDAEPAGDQATEGEEGEPPGSPDMPDPAKTRTANPGRKPEASTSVPLRRSLNPASSAC